MPLAITLQQARRDQGFVRQVQAAQNVGRQIVTEQRAFRRANPGLNNRGNPLRQPGQPPLQRQNGLPGQKSPGLQPPTVPGRHGAQPQRQGNLPLPGAQPKGQGNLPPTQPLHQGNPPKQGPKPLNPGNLPRQGELPQRQGKLPPLDAPRTGSDSLPGMPRNVQNPPPSVVQPQQGGVQRLPGLRRPAPAKPAPGKPAPKNKKNEILR